MWLAAGWWAVCGMLTLFGATPYGPTVWVLLLGAVGNLIWAVQARSVPVFYGRRPPTGKALAGPALLLNLGTAAIVASPALPTALSQIGFAMAGLGLAWVAPLAGSVRGVACRLREPSRPVAAFIVTADRWALVAGGFLVMGAALTWFGERAPASRFDEAAIHAIGLGLATTLIVGMARLLAPVFAIARATARTWRGSLRVVWLSLTLGTLCRVVAALLDGAIPTGFSVLLFSLAGLFTLAGLGLFAVGFVSAWAQQAGRRRLRGGAVPGAFRST